MDKTWSAARGGREYWLRADPAQLGSILRQTALWTLLGLPLFVLPAPSAAATSDDQIKQSIIQESIASYPGNCPCPYDYAANGSRCGKRSAWSRAGGYSPICYPEEVTPSMIEAWRIQNGE